MLRQCLLTSAFLAVANIAFAGIPGYLPKDSCAAHLSPGPANATYEIVMKNLPPSNSTHPVHVQWYGAREAPGYDVMSKETWWIVYRKIECAYPKFNGEGYNGGNVRVNETGHAVLRFMAPSTYRVCGNRIRYPHMIFRICTGENNFIERHETIDLTLEGPKVSACMGQSKFAIASTTNIRTIPPFPHAKFAKDTTTTRVTTTTLREITTTKFLELAETDVEPPKADTSYDWAALEFSPVYHCLLKSKVMNYFLDTPEQQCSDTCPNHAEKKHGQCVRKATGNPVEFNAAWTLKVECDQDCWNMKTVRSRHYLRLAIADHLDITFQEVGKVVLRPGTITSRRLSDGKTITDASLHISVQTDRIDHPSGTSLLRDFLPSNKAATDLLAMDVHDLKLVDSTGPTDMQPGEEKDEFIELYDEVENGNAVVGPSSGEESGGIAMSVVVAAAAITIFLGAAISLGLWWRLRRVRKANNVAMAQANKMEEKIEGVIVSSEKVGASEGKEEITTESNQA